MLGPRNPWQERLVDGTCLNSAVDGRKEPNHWICCPRATALRGPRFAPFWRSTGTCRMWKLSSSMLLSSFSLSLLWKLVRCLRITAKCGSLGWHLGIWPPCSQKPPLRKSLESVEVSRPLLPSCLFFSVEVIGSGTEGLDRFHAVASIGRYTANRPVFWSTYMHWRSQQTMYFQQELEDHGWRLFAIQDYGTLT